MPVSYSYEASNNKLFGQLRLLFKWNGSIWKVLFLDAILYFVLYSVIRVIKELALTKNQEEWFDEVGGHKKYYISCCRVSIHFDKVAHSKIRF